MPRALWLLIIGMAVNVIGSSFLWPLNTIYIHDHLGKSLSVAGIVLMLNAGATVIGNLVGGNLFDKIGGYKSILLGIAISLIALIGLTFWHGWPTYVIFLTIVGVGTGIIFPAMYAMAGSVWKEGGRKSFNALYVAQNVGVAIGTALGGIVAEYSFQLIFLANTVMYILFLFIAVFGYRSITVKSSNQQAVNNKSVTVTNRANLQALLILCFGYLLCWVAYVQWTTTIASYMQDVHISLSQYSFLWTVNGALIVLVQPLLNGVLKHLSISLKVQILIGIAFFIVSFFIASKAEIFTGFLTAMIIVTIGEMFIWPAVPTIAFTLSPGGREGFYQGIVNSTATCGRMIGPLLGGMVVDLYNMSALFTILMGLFVVSIITTLFYDRGIKGKEQIKDKSMVV
ncbi:MDR family MFS transporter [Neobacillus thermocopriae]|uniref:MFS transporter n=1 Tax=Neobacillus thermocopriae TaxID=1215031 RepID=A0A6B3TNT3_9BACI|nr:MFS transporter [Neobacillus thermocopriae]MED3622802.1 MFS transporter [Neobacillus thermocopriae]MED3714238.1 MFS transporter [Neobacillus thermocopriae]NEX78645.1 MFS transporter [Neobacillus thermocopriae]